MIRTTRFVLLTALFLSCDSGGVTDPGAPLDPSKPRFKAQSGSRLIFREVKHTTEDGGELIEGTPRVYDSKLKTECMINFAYPAEDGVKRCIPQSSTFTQNYYADAACTMSVGITTSCSVDRFASEDIANPNGCGYVRRIYEVGAELTGSIYQKQGASCNVITLNAGYKIYKLNRKLEPAEFVKITTEEKDIAN